jgi:hypothetical protein
MNVYPVRKCLAFLTGFADKGIVFIPAASCGLSNGVKEAI